MIEEQLLKQRLDHYTTLLKKADHANLPHIFALNAVIHELEYLAGQRQTMPTIRV